ncbi:NAD(P)-binding protein [Bimuria novae-zelandiae CBS 107.79]|uniref:Short-chain dehydrogenase/reductase 3 n=1 Tax=Bimuria novae-zelandiae CBS 107.79 TaxID=1447943 RepID=A0A6A5VR96_9PLEO|nr:NAD(P)-binding protein [Bimuria novae-zelandiae CBS 107.79]
MSSTLSKLVSLLATAVSHATLNPAVTGMLLWILTIGPAKIRNRLVNTVSALRNPQTLARVTKILKGLLALGLTRSINKTLNELALNGYRINNEKRRWKWNEEIAVVTGGCSGIGLLVVKRLVLKGVKVAILDIQQLPPALQGYAGIQFFSCDIADPSAVASTADKVRATLGLPTILVNNAGITEPHPILDTSPEYLRKIFDVNVLSHWYTAQAFLPDMIQKNKGHVVTVASLGSFVTVAGMVDYTATKQASFSLHEGLAVEARLKHKASNILFTSVHPIWVRTPLINPLKVTLEAAGSKFLEPAEVANAIAEQILKCSGGQLILPASLGWLTWIRGLPNWLQERVRGKFATTVLASIVKREREARTAESQTNTRSHGATNPRANSCAYAIEEAQQCTDIYSAQLVQTLDPTQRYVVSAGRNATKELKGFNVGLSDRKTLAYVSLKTSSS